MKVGIIGLGDISLIHRLAIGAYEDAEIVAVCDVDTSKQADWPQSKFYEDLDQLLLAEQDLDVIHICLPHYLHVEAAKKVVDKGINVFLEKPIGINVDEAEDLIAYAAQYPNVHVALCMQNRLNETFELLQQKLENKELGAIKGIKGLVVWGREQNYYDAKPWRGSRKLAGGGVMINQSIHTIDLIQKLGGTIDTINARVMNITDLDIEVEDTVTAQILFANGIKATYYATNSYTTNTSVEISVQCEKGTYTIYDQCLYEIDQEGNKKLLIEDSKMPGSKFYYGASHQKCIHNFYDGLKTNKPNYVSLKQGLTSMEIIRAIETSSEKLAKITMEECTNV